METDHIAFVLLELAVGVIIGFTVWTYVAPMLSGVTPPTA